MDMPRSTHFPDNNRKDGFDPQTQQPPVVRKPIKR
jgi:hypothetical protein